jgi:hypothetical protein
MRFEQLPILEDRFCNLPPRRIHPLFFIPITTPLTAKGKRMCKMTQNRLGEKDLQVVRKRGHKHAYFLGYDFINRLEV